MKPSVKYLAIYRHKDRYSIVRMCKFFEVSRSGYYAFVKRMEHRYFNLTKEYNITPSMSRRGNCYDNAMAENFFSILKSECIYRKKINTFSDARDLIDDYIWFYNNERIQLKTKLTPLELRCQFI